jgi:hypothetical protein
MSEEKFTIYLLNFRVLKTEADGGHRYLSTMVDYKGNYRELTAFFAHKEDEDKIDETIPVILKGDLLDDNHNHPLLLLNTEIVVEQQKG